MTKFQGEKELHKIVGNSHKDKIEMWVIYIVKRRLGEFNAHMAHQRERNSK